MTFAAAAVVLGDDDSRPRASRSPPRARRRARSPRRRSPPRAARRRRAAAGSPSGRRPRARPAGARSRSRSAPRRRASSTPSTTRSANRPRRRRRAFTAATIQSPPWRGFGTSSAARSRSSSRAAGGGAGRGVRHPRAPPRPVARRDPRRPLRHEPPARREQIAAAARPARHHPRGRRRRSHRARALAEQRLELAADAALARELDHARADGESQAAIPFDLKTTMSSSDARPWTLAGDDLLQLVHLEPVEDAALDRLDQVARLDAAPARASRSRRTPRARAPRCRARGAAASFAPTAQTSAPSAQPLAAQHRILRRRHGDDDVLLGRLAVRLRRARSRARAERGEPLARCGSRRRRARSTARAARMHATCDAACQPQPITPRRRRAGPREVARRDAATPRRCGAARACRPRSPPRARACSSEKSRTTNGVPPASHA